MATFVIKTVGNQDLGFLLIASGEGDWPSAGWYDCIFTGFPADTSLWDDPRGLFVMDHKGQEWKADVSHADTQMTVRIAFDSGWTFELHSNHAGNRWFAEGDGNIIFGTGEFL